HPEDLAEAVPSVAQAGAIPKKLIPCRPGKVLHRILQRAVPAKDWITPQNQRDKARSQAFEELKSMDAQELDAVLTSTKRDHQYVLFAVCAFQSISDFAGIRKSISAAS